MAINNMLKFIKGIFKKKKESKIGIKSLDEVLDMLKEVKFNQVKNDGNELIRCMYESDRLKNLFEEIDLFIKKNDNNKELKYNPGDYTAFQRFNKKLKDCSIAELIMLGFEGKFLTKSDTEKLFLEYKYKGELI